MLDKDFYTTWKTLSSKHKILKHYFMNEKQHIQFLSYNNTSSHCTLFFFSGIMKPYWKVPPPTTFLNKPTSSSRISLVDGNMHEFKNFFVSVLNIWLKFALHFNENATTDTFTQGLVLDLLCKQTACFPNIFMDFHQVIWFPAPIKKKSAFNIRPSATDQAKCLKGCYSP